MIKWTLNCITVLLVLFFLFLSSTELLRFYYWNINNCYKNFSFLFLFFLYATMTLVYVMKEIFQKIWFISFWWLAPPLLFFKIVFHSVQLGIPLISSLRNIYLRHAVFSFYNGMHCPSISIRTFITSYIWFLKLELTTYFLLKHLCCL